ncbi:uncharacterized protein LOC113318506 [Papaver somniferum]|nr:uncharacterized protein LOC113318506 [Papaver somniferum]
MFLSRFQRLRNSKARVVDTLALPYVKKKVLNSWSACQDTYFSTKDIFERHKVVFTISTSLASVGTAWIGYSLRYIHNTKVEKKLESIEKAMKDNKNMEQDELKKLVGYNVSLASSIATAGTTLVIGYALGWRGGKWFANRKFRKEQLKMLGMKTPARWKLPSLRNPFPRLPSLKRRLRLPGKPSKKSDTLADTAVTTNSGNLQSVPR